MSERSATELDIDVSLVATARQLHELLAQRLGFPDYYGHNWDAFDECIRDVTGPLVVRVTGFPGLRLRLPREAKLWLDCAGDLKCERVRFYFDGS
jgi:RNAse (barnase) inhibitor barstar